MLTVYLQAGQQLITLTYTVSDEVIVYIYHTEG